MRLPSDHLNRVGLRATAAVVVRHPDGEFIAQFSDEYYEAQLGGGPGTETVQPVLIARTIDVQSLAKDTPLEVGNEQYRLKSQQPDGTGESRVLLKR